MPTRPAKCKKCYGQFDANMCYKCLIAHPDYKDNFKEFKELPLEQTEYFKVLGIVENFIIKSGIREYCSTVCKGKCCGSCHENMKCGAPGVPRVMCCSLFVCSTIESLLEKIKYGNEVRKVLSELKSSASHTGMDYHNHDKSKSIQIFTTSADTKILSDEKAITNVKKLVTLIGKSNLRHDGSDAQRLNQALDFLKKSEQAKEELKRIKDVGLQIAE